MTVHEKKVEIEILLKISVKYSTISFYLLHTASPYFLEIGFIQRFFKISENHSIIYENLINVDQYK